MSMAWVSPKRLREFGMLGMNCRNVDFINRYNERRLFPLVDNKLKTKLLAQEYDVPTPGLKFVVREQHEISHIERELADLESFALKPAKEGAKYRYDHKGYVTFDDQEGYPAIACIPL